jgi:hypothetical protein
MELDETKLEECALAILSLTLHGDKYGKRAWKGLDWDLMDRLHENGWISDPKGKAKSVMFTDEGVERAEEYLRRHFAAGSS